LSTLEIDNTRNLKDINRFLINVKGIVIGNIIKELTRYNLKVNIGAFLGYERNEEEYQEINYKTRNQIKTEAANLD